MNPNWLAFSLLFFLGVLTGGLAIIQDTTWKTFVVCLVGGLFCALIIKEIDKGISRNAKLKEVKQ